MPATILKNLDVDIDNVRLEIGKVVKSGSDTAKKRKLPQTPRAKKVMAYSQEEAKSLNHESVSNEHILLGLLQVRDGVGAQVLGNLGVEYENVRQEVIELVGQGPIKGGHPTLVISGAVKDSSTGLPIGGVKVGDQHYLDGVRSTFTRSDGSYSYLTRPEHHSIKAESTGYKTQSKSLYKGHFDFGKEMVEEIIDFELTPEKATERSEFKATLPNGLSVELVGLGTAPWKSEQQWWRPDGTKIDKPKFKANAPPREWPEGSNRLQFQCATLYKFSNHEGKDISVPGVKFPNNEVLLHSSGSGSAIADRDGDKLQLYYIVSNPYEGVVPNKADISLAVGSEKFVQAKRIDQNYTPKQHQIYSLDRNKSTIILHPVRIGQVGTPCVDLTCRQENKDINCRVLAKLKNGETEQWHGGSIGKEVKFFQATPRRKNIKVEDIEQLIIEYRPYQWIEFKNVSLRPGSEQNVVSVEDNEKTDDAGKGSGDAWAPPVEAILGGEAMINGKWHKVGDTVGDARIVAIEPAQVRVELQGKEITLAPVGAEAPSSRRVSGRGRRARGPGRITTRAKATAPAETNDKQVMLNLKDAGMKDVIQVLAD